MSDHPSWHREPWRRTVEMRRLNRLPHALLLRGSPGVGKRRFADPLAAALLCESPAGDLEPCGRCRGCGLRGSSNHPDFLALGPAEPGKNISVAQIRDLIDYTGLTRHYGQAKVVIVEPASAMGRHAANTLLKTLEEPPAHTVFLLLTHLSELLPATIRSRCQILGFPVPPRPEARDWLATELGEEAAALPLDALLDAAAGAPYRALEVHRESVLETRAGVARDVLALAAGDADPVAVAQRWKKDVGAATLVNLTLDGVRAVVAGKLAPGAGQGSAGPPGFMRELTELFDFEALYSIFDRAVWARRALETRSTVNEQLMLEEFAVAWSSYRARTRPGR